MANQGVLVIAEIAGGNVSAVTHEALALGHKLQGTLGGDVAALAIGAVSDAVVKSLVSHGAQKVYAVNNPDLAAYSSDAYVQVLEQVIAKASPRLVILGQTDIGRDLAPKTAFRIKATLTMDCVDLSVEGTAIRATKPVYGGNAQAIYESAAPLHMVAIRGKAFEVTPANDAAQGEVEQVSVTIDQSKVKIKSLEIKKEQAQGMRLEDAPVVISGGRGLGGPEPFATLEELAKLLGGAVGASRAVCDAGWQPVAKQVGLTGKTVTPELYVAIAISGASQHMAGCSGAKNIVAINKDKDSSIFKESRFGVVGAWEEVLPAFTEMCRELRGA